MLTQLDLQRIQDIGIPTSTLRNGGRTSADFGRLITNILPYIFYGAGIALLLYLISGGLQLMTSRGDPKGVEIAKGKITNAIIGFVVIVFAYFLVNILARIFKLEGTYFGQIFNK